MTGLAVPSTLRPIEALPLAEPAVRGNPPHLGWVEIARLRIDDRYQRPLARHNWDAIRRIAENFDWALFTVVDIAPVRAVDGADVYAVIDGQHRVHAAAMVGIGKVPVRIVLAPVEGQARAFMGINGNVMNITPFHMLRASIAAGEPWALAADKAISRAGCRLMTSNASASEKKPGEIYAVQFVRSVVSRDGAVSDEGAQRIHVACASLMASREGAANPLLWTATPLRAWVTAIDALDDWLDHPSATRALTRFLDRVKLSSLLADAEDTKRRFNREGGARAPVHGLLMMELQGRLDEMFPAKADFIRAGGEGA